MNLAGSSRASTLWVCAEEYHRFPARTAILILIAKLYDALKKVGDLLIFVAMQRYDGARPHYQPHEHAPFSCNESPIEAWLEMLYRFRVKPGILKLRRLLRGYRTHVPIFRLSISCAPNCSSQLCS